MDRGEQKRAAVTCTKVTRAKLSSFLKADREVVFEAVKQDGEALQFAAEELRNDEGLLRIVKS